MSRYVAVGMQYTQSTQYRPVRYAASAEVSNLLCKGLITLSIALIYERTESMGEAAKMGKAECLGLSTQVLAALVQPSQFRVERHGKLNVIDHLAWQNSIGWRDSNGCRERRNDVM
ncbi:hypothetical protein [Stenotrophomonas geniculata]|uniref:hypothetical protein n=1 Tax=Stenotrophomonas geniculata TaxID=86188 RepID=UPI0011B44A26|nr:hypothetical protein [Stenotrophomonas geniculata]MCI1089698.1 hypothetical protein [Stenotrophomonas maltophilia]MCI1127435.1 hypothetical protein [Stenotrophomonas maltophilia]MDP9617863.1 hypothetical protein [Stenotrophomonas maltophilia]UXB26089.1 hypothetical protein K7567_10140 [Stenotrophomonas maltophilia]